MKPNLTTVFKPNLVKANNNQEQIKNLQEGVANLTPKIENQDQANFLESIKNAIGDVSSSQKKSAELTKYAANSFLATKYFLHIKILWICLFKVIRKKNGWTNNN